MRRCGNKEGGEYHSQCPMCGHGPKSTPQTSDRFMVWPNQGDNGTYYCRGCHKGGDAIQYLRDVEGLTYRGACLKIGVDPTSPITTTTIPAKRKSVGFTPTARSLPPTIWQEKAALLVSHCHNELLNNTSQLDW
ncbi:MAG: hypothetical protein KAU50_02970, partial [Candidatus Marinimicrobia bacterium]|nr:hypothetical protein [Candidatus Neomarinimicrobiota bacterium]